MVIARFTIVIVICIEHGPEEGHDREERGDRCREQGSDYALLRAAPRGGGRRGAAGSGGDTSSPVPQPRGRPW